LPGDLVVDRGDDKVMSWVRTARRAPKLPDEKPEVTGHSARNYLYRIFEKLGYPTRVELIFYISSPLERDERHRNAADDNERNRMN
jgi:hypothetical protein